MDNSILCWKNQTEIYTTKESTHTLGKKWKQVACLQVILIPPACNQIFCKHIIISKNTSKNKYSYSRKTIDVLSSTWWEKMPLIVGNYLILQK